MAKNQFGSIKHSKEGFDLLKPGEYYKFERFGGKHLYGKFSHISEEGSFLHFDEAIDFEFSEKGFYQAIKKGNCFFRVETISGIVASSKNEFKHAIKKGLFLQEYLGKYIIIEYDDSTIYYGKLAELRKTTCLLCPFLDKKINNGFWEPYIERKIAIEISFNGVHLIQRLRRQEKGLEDMLAEALKDFKEKKRNFLREQELSISRQSEDLDMQSNDRL